MIKKILLKYSHWFQDYFTSNGLNIELCKILNIIIIGILFFGFIYVFDKIIKSIVIKLFKYFSSKSKNTFDDYLVLSNFPRYISHTIPLFITWHYIPILFK
ncbi:MAG: mechanosensitive ion channel protein MscS, partial [Flavobacterium sp.]